MTSATTNSLMTNRVAITGCGVVCALGNSFVELGAALRAGRSGVRLMATGASARPGVAACPLLDTAASELSTAERALFDPVTRYAMLAAQEAIDQSGALEDPAVCRAAAVYMGTAVGGAFTIDDAYRDIWYHGAPPRPLAIVCGMTNAPAAHMAIRFGLKGPNFTYAVACASSAIAIGEAFHAIRAGRISCAIAGGAEACVTPGMVRAWHAMRALACVDRSAPSETCRPFSEIALASCWVKAPRCSYWSAWTPHFNAAPPSCASWSDLPRTRTQRMPASLRSTARQTP